MNKIILKKESERFSYIKYFLFRWMKIYSVYDCFIENDIFFIPFKKSLKSGYLKAMCEFLKKKEISHILAVDEDVSEYMKNHFSVINGKNIYNAIFCEVLDFMADGRLYDYEVIFVSDNIKIIKEEIKKCVKKVKAVSVLTHKPYLYESIKDMLLSKYGVTLNIRTKNDRLKKNKKIYINSGANRVFSKDAFKKVNMIDIFGVYEGAFRHIIMEPDKDAKEYTKRLKCPYSAPLAEFLYDSKMEKTYKIVNIKK